MTHPIPPHVESTIRLHLAERHGVAEPDPSEIGAPTSRKCSVMVTWKDDPDDLSGAWVRCRRCPPGRDLFRAEVRWPFPTPRLEQRIAHHLDQRHDVARFHPRMTKTTPEQTDCLVTFVPASEMLPASIICSLCPQLRNRIYLGEPAYGDARRHAQLLVHDPDLRARAGRHAGQARAEVIEAWDRQLHTAEEAHAARHVLVESRRGTAQREDDHVRRATRRILDQRTQAGERITRVITDLDGLSDTDPAAYTALVGEHIPALGHHAQREAPERFADRVMRFLGSPDRAYLTTSKSTLWNLWTNPPAEPSSDGGMAVPGKRGRV